MILKRKNILIGWFLFLLASFAYEKPIAILSSIDRLNPRLFDIATFTALFILPYLKKEKSFNPLFSKYKNLILWFGACAVFSLVVYSFPVEINQYVIFYYLKYLQELFILYVVYKILMQFVPVKQALIVFLLSGLFVFGYSLYEFYYGVVGEIEFAPGKFINKPVGIIWGPFGNTYFQIATYLPLLFILLLGYASIFTGLKRYILYLISFLIAWPLLFTGSRTGLGLLLITLTIYFVLRYKFSYGLVLVAIFSIVVLFATNNLSDKSFQTVERLETMESHDSNSLVGRLTIFSDFSLEKYTSDGILMPFFGGGFYVAPIDDKFRIGYGFHNIYVFAFEQAGLFGLFFFLLFLKEAFNYLKKALNLYSVNRKSIEFVFIAGVFSYFIAELIVGLAGHTFWRGFATNNFNTLRIIVLLMAVALYLRVQVKKKLISEEGVTTYVE
ncbi:O-antigen ligase family protein [Salinimicrobium tongyeongense]|nr:O-antigen ligase family protein [Salinimicrobium tongyeongense]